MAFLLLLPLSYIQVVNASLSDDMASFANFLKFEKRYSQHTLRAYSDDLDQLSTFLAEQFGDMPVDQLNSGIIRSWLASLKEAGLTARSLNRKISSLKSFFRYLQRTGRLTKDPLSGISSPKSGRQLPSFVEEGQVHTLFEHVEFSDDWAGMTARLSMLLLYQLGLRLSELISCRERDVDVSNAQIKVLGKGNKERIIPVAAPLLAEIAAYLAAKRTRLTGADTEYLLVNERGRKLYPRYVQRLTEGYLRLVTTIERKSPHVLRHSFATHLANNGAELNAVKELLGHASLAATQVYTHNTIGKLKNVHKKAHPRG